ncbi:MAG TPA: vWA domain-containing protein, partial [Terriglobia bacterium]|nr:vWA domain-containing protein [Terriglobia bacterium]
MRLTFETLWPLILALVIPCLWWMRRYTAAGLSPKQFLLSTLIRTVIVALLVAALMGPVIHWPGAAVSSVYLLDVSQSIAPSAIQNAVQWIRETNKAGNPSDAHFIAFASNSKGFEHLDDLTQVAVSSEASRNAIDQSRTDIASALERAILTFAPDHLKRLVLLTDGNDNVGDIANVVTRLKSQNVKVFTVPLAVRSNQDVWIESMI